MPVPGGEMSASSMPPYPHFASNSPYGGGIPPPYPPASGSGFGYPSFPQYPTAGYPAGPYSPTPYPPAKQPVSRQFFSFNAAQKKLCIIS